MNSEFENEYKYIHELILKYYHDGEFITLNRIIQLLMDQPISFKDNYFNTKRKKHTIIQNKNEITKDWKGFVFIIGIDSINIEYITLDNSKTIKSFKEIFSLLELQNNIDKIEKFILTQLL